MTTTSSTSERGRADGCAPAIPAGESRSRVHKIVIPHDGPTSNADCLNWVYHGIAADPGPRVRPEHGAARRRAAEGVMTRAFVAVVIGTRPEAIKMAPIVHALRDSPTL